MIRGLFFDLDGTLLNGQKCLSPANAAALQACRAKGLQLFLATARPPLLERMLGWGPAVLCGGRRWKSVSACCPACGLT